MRGLPILISVSLILFFLLFPVKVVPQDDGQKIDYAKLDLNKNLLKGSRWSIDKMKKVLVNKGEKVKVYHAVEIVDISKVDVDTMSIRIEIHMRQRWEADEMQLPDGLFADNDPPEVFIQANPKILDSLWSPDSYIPVARDTKIASFTVQQSVVNIFANRTIIYKARLYTILGCMFDFSWYPLDKQMCTLNIESYTTTSELVEYMWETNQQPVVYSNLKLLQYDLHFPMKYGNGSALRWGRGGSYPYVNLDFVFERQLGHHMIQVFIPTTLVVILSWFSFWLGLDAIPGRISLLITCMLTLVTMHSGMKGAIPPVNYIKMMDIWMVGCMTFVFLALCEFVVVKYLHWKKQIALKAAEDKEKAMKVYMDKIKDIEAAQKGSKDRGGGGGGNNKPAAFNPYLEFYRNMALHKGDGGGLIYPREAWGPGGMMMAPPGLADFGAFAYPRHPNDEKPKERPSWVRIDRVSRVLFPLSFGVFNVTFWPYLIIGAENQ